MPRAKTSLLGTPCARCLALGRTVPAIHGNVLCEDDVRRDLCDAHRKEVRALVGRFSQGVGDSFEKWVEGALDAALRLGIITHWVHNMPVAKMIHGQWKPVAPGIADYSAIGNNQHGTLIATEAKNYARRLPRNEISREQQRHLDAVVRAGGLAFLLARIRDEGVAQNFAVPWQSVPWAVAKSAQSVTAADLAPWKVPADCRCYLEKFCDFRGAPAPGAVPRRVYARE